MSLAEKIREAKELLIEVVEKRGAYSRDQLTHAENVIENASERAKKATEILDDVLAVVNDNLQELQELSKNAPFLNLFDLIKEPIPQYTYEALSRFIEDYNEYQRKVLAKVEELMEEASS